MAVHVIRNQPNYLRAGLFNTAFNVLGDQVGGMINRSREAADNKKYRKGWEALHSAMTPSESTGFPEMEIIEDPSFSGGINYAMNQNSLAKDFGRDYYENTAGLGKGRDGTAQDFAGAMMKAGTPGLFKDAFELYKDKFGNQEKARFAGESRDTFLNNGGIDRSNPNLSFANVADLTGRGIDTTKALESFFPHRPGSIVDTGDKMVPVTLDPVTGDYTQGTAMDKGVNPDHKYTADSNVKVAQTNAGATAAQPKYSMIQGEDGQIYSYDQRTGLVYKDGQLVQGVKAPPKNGNLQVANALKYLEMVGRMYQFSDMPPEVQAQVKQAQAIVAGSFMGGGVPQDDPIPVPPTENDVPVSTYTYPTPSIPQSNGVYDPRFNNVAAFGNDANNVQIPQVLVERGLTPEQVNAYMKAKNITNPNDAIAIFMQELSSSN